MPVKPPTRLQQNYLRALAQRTGQTFTPPRTSAEASREIRRLKAVTPTSRNELAYERGFLAEENAARAANCDVAIHESEIEGFGSNCQWSHR